ncbi:MAG: CRISPR-associated endoribonuclease Cas6 [Candidatus Jordarchaeales archaeon]
MPLGLVVKVSALSSGGIRRFSGHLVRGGLLGFFAKVDPGLANALHAPNQLRPYSVSPAFPVGKGRVHGDLFHVRVGDEFRFRLGFLVDEVGEKLLERLFDFKVKLGEVDFSLVEVGVKRKSYEELIEGVSVSDRFRVFFRTPTQLSVHGVEFPFLFPDPRYIYPSVARLWNAFAPDYVKVDVDELYKWVSDNVYVRNYSLRTVTVSMGKERRVAGFVGHADFYLKKTDGYAPWVAVLSEYATYSNIGVKRTGGMGVVDVELPKKEKSGANS